LAVESSGSLNWTAIPDACYSLAGVADTTMRAINRSLNAVGRSTDDMHLVNGMSALRAALHVRPLPVLMPDVLATRFCDQMDFTFHTFSPTSVQCQFSIITPWGYMNQIDLNALRGQNCFVVSADDTRAKA
jgi:hypothetical protein